MAVPGVRRLVAGLSLWRPEFDPRSVYVRFLVDQMKLGQVSFSFLRKFLFSIVSIVPPMLFTLSFIYTLLLPEEQKEDAWEPSHKQCSSKAVASKALTLFFR